MKALSMKQPWAWLVCAGIKDTENRYWHLRAGLPRRIYVHASKTIDRKAFEWLAQNIPRAILAQAIPPAYTEYIGGHLMRAVTES